MLSSAQSSRVPTRLALHTGELDDHRPSITPQHEFWDSAHAVFRERHHFADSGHGVGHDDAMNALCASWPQRDGPPENHEAVAVVLALTAPFAGNDRVLEVLSIRPEARERSIADAVVIASPPDRPRRPLPRVYDPDAEDRAPIIAVLDGPRSATVAELLNRIKERDPNLADAVVLGADLEMLDLLERLCADAKGAGRRNLEEMFEHDKLLWRGRADAARARNALEGMRYYGWRTDNIPPACLKAARGEIQHNVLDDLYRAPPAS